MGNDRDDRDPFDDIFRELSRMMNDMMGEDFEMHVERDAGFGDDVHVTTQETPEEVYVIADLPGVEKDAIDIKCDGRTVTIARPRAELYARWKDLSMLPRILGTAHGIERDGDPWADMEAAAAAIPDAERIRNI